MTVNDETPARQAPETFARQVAEIYLTEPGMTSGWLRQHAERHIAETRAMFTAIADEMDALLAEDVGAEMPAAQPPVPAPVPEAAPRPSASLAREIADLMTDHGLTRRDVDFQPDDRWLWDAVAPLMPERVASPMDAPPAEGSGAEAPAAQLLLPDGAR